MKFVISSLFFIFSVSLVGYSGTNIDSLLNVLDEQKDTTKIKTLLAVSSYYQTRGDVPNAKKYCQWAIDIAGKERNKHFLAISLYRMGGHIYNSEANFTMALDYMLQAQKLADELSDMNLLYLIANDIGNSYIGRKQYDKALESYGKAYTIAHRLNFELGEYAAALGKGNVYNEGFKDYPKALAAFQDAAQGFYKLNNEYACVMAKVNIANVYVAMNENNKAIEYYEALFPIAEKINNQYILELIFAGMGNAYMGKKQYSKALENYYKSVEIGKAISNDYDLKIIYKSMADVYNKQGRHDSAYRYLELSYQLSDTIYNEQNSKAIAEMQTKYDTQAKEKENQELLLKQELNDTKIKQQSRLTIGLAAFIGVVVVFAFFLFRSNRIKQKQNQIISAQKEQVEQQRMLLHEKNKEVQDSINYAFRIQQAVLPEKQSIDESLKDYFLFYQPKDIVSGDFYWIDKKLATPRNSQPAQEVVAVAAVDCTGHGVPGALMSAIGSTLLKQTINRATVHSAGEVVTMFNKKVSDTLSTIKDGMDMSLCIIDFEKLELQYAGANNPIYVVTDHVLTTDNTATLLEFKATKNSIGADVKDTKIFVNNTLQLQKNDCIYLFTDGYADQFGGVNDKKYNYKRFKELLLRIHKLSMDEQRQIIEQEFVAWKRNKEQVDDILVIGIRV